MLRISLWITSVPNYDAKLSKWFQGSKKPLQKALCSRWNERPWIFFLRMRISYLERITVRLVSIQAAKIFLVSASLFKSSLHYFSCWWKVVYLYMPAFFGPCTLLHVCSVRTHANPKRRPLMSLYASVFRGRTKIDVAKHKNPIWFAVSKGNDKASRTIVLQCVQSSDP